LALSREAAEMGDSRQITTEELRVSEAYHEAGHALAYIACGLDFDEIDLKYDKVRAAPRTITGYQAAFVTWAGALAQYRHAFTDPKEFEERWDHFRFEYFAETAEYVAELEESGNDELLEEERDSDVATLLNASIYDRDHGLRDAGYLLDEHWDAVERLAAAVVERGVVTYGEVVEIVGRVDDWFGLQALQG
jgi:hypothetical protein